MRRKLSLVAGLLAILFLGSSYTLVPTSSLSYSPDVDAGKNELLFDMIMDGMQRAHYSPAIFNDDFSRSTFSIFLKTLDRNKRFLLAEDIEELKKHETTLDDAIRSRDLTFFYKASSVIALRIEEVSQIYPDLLNRPFNYSIDETIELDFEKRDYPITKKERKDSWRKSLKYQTLSNTNKKLKAQEKAKEKSDTVAIKTFAELEIDARTKLIKTYNSYFKRLAKIKESDRFSAYMNSLIGVFDPHSGYFPPKDKENFDIYMSGQLEGIGAQLQENDGRIKVTRIVPGSASWKQGDLKAGDFITAVAQGSEESVDITDMRLDDAVKLIRGKKGTEVRLTVLKVDGSEILIPIIRDVVILEETYAKSVILENNKRTGYIKLPKFYMDMNKQGGRSCAADVKLEIEKLKAEGIDGLILDLRNNGGGSLGDAVKMAGFFIKEGPIVQVKGRMGAPYVMKDNDPEIYYDGPLVIMVNSFSVSASEIVAAALQDYERAIILGSKVTYGKGTVQRFINLDNAVTGDQIRYRPLGAIKMTTQKFYRINGGATQLKGVASNIEMPYKYAYIDIGEKELDHYLIWDEIKPADYTKTGMYKNLKFIQEESAKRMANSNKFQLIDGNAKRLKANRDRTLMPLKKEAYQADINVIADAAKKYENIHKDSTGLKVFSIKIDLEAMATDTAKIERTKEWHGNLVKDLYLFEATEIIKDMNSASVGMKQPVK
ncbi:MAG: tail-specific protease [Bacteroidetes bacterium]|nr:MAG: tail-specific protease [Bacteroidota bacterium]